MVLNIQLLAGSSFLAPGLESIIMTDSGVMLESMMIYLRAVPALRKGASGFCYP